MSKSERPKPIPVAPGTGQISFGETGGREFHARAALDLLPDDEPLLTKTQREKKFLCGSGSIEKEKCLTPDEAFEWVCGGGNYGFALSVDGGEFGSLGVLDIEEPNSIPEVVIEWADEHALLAYGSPHGGENRLLRLTSEAHELLYEAETKIDVDGDGNHELELLATSHAIGPGSVIHHEHCYPTKSCNGMEDGTDQYRLTSVNESRPLVTLTEVRELLDLLDVDIDERSDENTASKGFDWKDLPDEHANPESSPNTSKTIEKSGEDTLNTVEYDVEQRLEKMFESEKGEKIRALWEGRYKEIAKDGSGDRSADEQALANYLGWWFENNEKLVRRLMTRACREYPKTSDDQDRKWNEDGGNYRRNTARRGCKYSTTYAPSEDQLPYEERPTVGKPTQQRVHQAVNELENPNLSDILEHDRVDRKERQVQRTLKSLIEDGFVEKQPDVLDSRKNVYNIPDIQ